MPNHRKQRFRSDDLRRLEELVWRDLNAVVRAANGRAVADGALHRSAQSSKSLDHEAQYLEELGDAAEPSPADSESGDAAASHNGLEAPMLIEDADGLALGAVDAGQEGESAPTTGHVATPAGGEWSDRGDGQFIDEVAQWLHHQAHPDQAIAEIWGRLLALRAPALGPEAPMSEPRLQ